MPAGARLYNPAAARAGRPSPESAPVSTPTFELAVIRNGKTARVVPAGELDIATVPRVERMIAELTVDAQHDLVVDLRELTFMDSTGLRMLVQTHGQSKRTGFGLQIVRGPEQINRLFVVTGLDGVLPLVDAPPEGT